MSSTKGELGSKAPNFSLLDIYDHQVTLDDFANDSEMKGFVVMFICNHCPYVLSKIDRIVKDVASMQREGIRFVAIMPNDYVLYPEDSPSKMKNMAEEKNFSFPYLLDETQQVAKDYGAVCTPDIFGYNKNLLLKYRGRFDASMKDKSDPGGGPSDLMNAMLEIASSGDYTKEQYPSMGCSIKWKS